MIAKFRERAIGYINKEEDQETKKAEACQKSGKNDDSKQSQKQ